MFFEVVLILPLFYHAREKLQVKLSEILKTVKHRYIGTSLLYFGFIANCAAVFSGRHVLYFFERRRKLTGAVVSDLGAAISAMFRRFSRNKISAA